MSGGMGEPEKRHAGHHPGAHEQKRQSRPGSGKMLARFFSKIEQPYDRQRDNHGRLDEQAGNRCGAGDFAQETIKTERKAESESNPWQTTHAQGQIKNSAGREQNREELRTAETFTQEDCSEEHVYEGRHEVA